MKIMFDQVRRESTIALPIAIHYSRNFIYNDGRYQLIITFFCWMARWFVWRER